MAEKYEQVLETLRRVDQEKLEEADASFEEENAWLQDIVLASLETVKRIRATQKPADTGGRVRQSRQKAAAASKKGRGKRPAVTVLETVAEEGDEEEVEADDHIPEVKIEQPEMETEQAEPAEDQEQASGKRKGRKAAGGQTRSTRQKRGAQKDGDEDKVDIAAEPPIRTTRSRRLQNTVPLAEAFPSPPRTRRTRAKKIKLETPPAEADAQEVPDQLESAEDGVQASESAADLAQGSQPHISPPATQADQPPGGGSDTEEPSEKRPSLPTEVDKAADAPEAAHDGSMEGLHPGEEEPRDIEATSPASMGPDAVADHQTPSAAQQRQEVGQTLHPEAEVSAAMVTPAVHISPQKVYSTRSRSARPAWPTSSIQSRSKPRSEVKAAHHPVTRMSAAAVPLSSQKTKSLGEETSGDVFVDIDEAAVDTPQNNVAAESNEEIADHDRRVTAGTPSDQRKDETDTISDSPDQEEVQLGGDAETRQDAADGNALLETPPLDQNTQPQSPAAAELTAPVLPENANASPHEQTPVLAESLAKGQPTAVEDDDTEDVAALVAQASQQGSILGDMPGATSADAMAQTGDAALSQNEDNVGGAEQTEVLPRVTAEIVTTSKTANGSQPREPTKVHDKKFNGPNLVTTHRSLLPTRTNTQPQMPAAGRKVQEVDALKLAEQAKRKEAAREAEKQRHNNLLKKQKADRAKHAQQVKANQEEAQRRAAEESKKREEAARRKEEEAAARRKAKEEADRREKEEKQRRLEEAKARKRQEELRKQEEQKKRIREQEQKNLQKPAAQEQDENRRPKVADFFAKAAALMAPLKPTAPSTQPLATETSQLSMQRLPSAELPAMTSSSLFQERSQATANLPPVAEGVESIEIAPYRSDGESEDEEEDEQQNIPAWAQEGNLRREIVGQQRLDPDELFQQHEKTCSLDEVFSSIRGPESQRDLSRRTSTGNWLEDRVTWKEEMNYKKAMGYI